MNYAACALEEAAELFVAAIASGGISLPKEDQIRIFGNGFFFFFLLKLNSTPYFLFTLNGCWIVLPWVSKCLVFFFFL